MTCICIYDIALVISKKVKPSTRCDCTTKFAIKLYSNSFIYNTSLYFYVQYDCNPVCSNVYYLCSD